MARKVVSLAPCFDMPPTVHNSVRADERQERHGNLLGLLRAHRRPYNSTSRMTIASEADSNLQAHSKIEYLETDLSRGRRRRKDQSLLLGRGASFSILLICVHFWVRPICGALTDATRSTSTGNGLQYATAGVLAQFTVTAYEEDGRRRTSGGDDFIVQLAGTRALYGSVIDNLDGSYQATYVATKSGAYEMSVKLLGEGGLTASYFENVWFFYTPVLVSVDPQINHDWGTGLLTATASDYVSVRWAGKVKPYFTETYTFIATSDDGSKLWVDGVPLIDRWDSYCNDTAATIALRSNVFVDIKMEYKEVVGTALVRLFWESPSSPRQLVPSSSFYFETHTAKSPFGLVVSPSFASGPHSYATGDGVCMMHVCAQVRAC